MDSLLLIILFTVLFEGLVFTAIAFGFLYLFAVKLGFLPTLETRKAERLFRMAEKAEDDKKYDETLREIAEKQKERRNALCPEDDMKETKEVFPDIAAELEIQNDDTQTPEFDELMDLLEMGLPGEELEKARLNTEDGIVRGV